MVFHQYWVVFVLKERRRFFINQLHNLLLGCCSHQHLWQHTTRPCLVFNRADSQVMLIAWFLQVTAICKGFPTLPHKESLAERQHVLRHRLLAGTTRSPLAVPLSVKQYNTTTLALPPTPILFTQSAPPCSHHPHTGHREWWHVFFKWWMWSISQQPGQWFIPEVKSSQDMAVLLEHRTVF